jgi:general secretion pathway protein D
MKRFHCCCLVLLIALASTLPASAESAGSLYSKGKKAEARQQYEEAYKYFKQAYDLHPEDTSYRSSFERTKFLAASSHVHRGQMLRDDGKLSEALKEFQLAVAIDASSGIAQQEIKRTQRMIEKAQQPATPTSRAPQEGLSESASNMAGPVQLAPISQTPLTLKLNESSRKVYEAIGSLAGINVLFDPDYVPRQIHIELNAVSLEQALQVVALESRTFWRPVTPNTVYIAQDTQQKRNEVEQQVLRTFYLSNFSTVSELQDVANLIRTILRVERVQQFPSQNVIVMRGTPDQVALAELLINNLDKAKSEVVVDIVVMQVSKTKLKQLGIQYPFQGGSSNPSISFQSPSITSSTTTSNTTGTTTPTTSTSGLTLNDLSSLTARDFAVSIPSSSVAFLMNDSNTNVIQRPQMRSVDGQKATLKIGERVPIAVGTSSSTLTATALTQTQFQYQDVGVNIEMTPHIHSNGEVSMKLSIEVSAIDSYQNIGGLTEPVIGQRKIDHEMRMRDGEVNLIGGMMEHDDVENMSGLPWVSQIPILKYLFGQGQKSKTDNETVFALMPHIVRRLDLDDLNIRAVDIGTQNVVEVHHMPKAPAAVVPVSTVPSGTPSAVAPPVPAGTQNVPGAAPAAASNSAGPQGGDGGRPGVAPAAANNVQTATPSGIGPVLSLDPPMVNQPAGATFAVNVVLNGGQNVFSVPVEIKYDPKVMSFVNVSNAGALSKDGAAVALVHRDDAAAGTVTISMMRPPGSNGISPSGPLFTMMFVAKTAGQGTVSVGKSVLRDPNMAAMEASGSQAIINVR